MPLVTALNYVYVTLSDLSVPGQGGSTLQAFINPPDPQTDQTNPSAYIWTAVADESRQSLPRASPGVPGTGTDQSGWKNLIHNIDVFLIWDQDASDPTP